MWKLCVALLCFIALVEGALLGGNKCTWGPSYWCKNFATAKDCSATSHCLENVWGKAQATDSLLKSSSMLKAEDSDVCIFCKDIVTDVKKLLLSNQTQGAVTSYLNRACSYMPSEYIQKCEDIGTQYFNELTQLIQKGVDPNQICEYLQMCQSIKSEPLSVNPVEPFVESISPSKIQKLALTQSSAVKVIDYPMCDLCKNMVKQIADALADQKNKDAVENFLLNECKALGNMAQECQTFVHNYLPEAFVFIEAELNDQACVFMTMCPNNGSADAQMAFKTRLYTFLSSSSLNKQILTISGNLKEDACKTCEMIAGYIKIFLSNDQMEKEVESALETLICARLEPLTSLCDELIKKELPALYSKLLELLDPQTLCTELKLCKNSSHSSLKLSPATPIKLNTGASPQCALCEFAMDELKNLISQKSTEDEIKNALKQVCSLLPKTITDECNALIDQYSDQIIKALIAGLNPEQICTMLQLCTSKVSSTGSNCVVCELAMSYVDSMLTKNATAQQVEETLQKVCNYLYADLAKECQAMIQQYLPDILKMLANDLKPKDICAKLGMCPATLSKVDGRVHLYVSYH